MGEVDIVGSNAANVVRGTVGDSGFTGSNRVVSEQPHLGSLFKSQNNKTWTPVQSEDLKFTLFEQISLQQ